MLSNTYTKISDIIENYKQDFNDIKRFKAFKSKWNPKQYSNYQNYYNGEHLEFGFRYDNLATQKSYNHIDWPQFKWFPHDVIFECAPNMLIDLKRYNRKHRGITITKKNKLKQYELGQVTHIGIWDCDENDKVYEYKLLKLLPWKVVWDNLKYVGSDVYEAYNI